MLILVKASNKFVIPERLSVRLYESVEVKCSSTTEPEWYFEGKKIVPENDRSLYNSWLYIDNVVMPYIGTYTCYGTSPEGAKFEEDFVLTLIGKFPTKSFQLLYAQLVLEIVPLKVYIT